MRVESDIRGFRLCTLVLDLIDMVSNNSEFNPQGTQYGGRVDVSVGCTRSGLSTRFCRPLGVSLKLEGDDMTFARLAALGLVVLLGILPAAAHAGPTYQSLWNDATKQPDCVQSSFSDYILVTCQKDMTLWYFTKPNHPAHPGVVRRIIVQEKGVVTVQEVGTSFASTAAQPAFKAWLAKIRELDRQTKDYLAQPRVTSPQTDTGRDPTFSPGQMWSIKDSTIRIVIGRVESFPGGKTAVSISVFDVPCPSGSGCTKTTVAHAPFDREILATSVDRLVGTDQPTAPSFENGYDNWKTAHGGIFTIPVKKLPELLFKTAGTPIKNE